MITRIRWAQHFSIPEQFKANMCREWVEGKRRGLPPDFLFYICRAFQIQDRISESDLLEFIQRFICETKREPFLAIKMLYTSGIGRAQQVRHSIVVKWLIRNKHLAHACHWVGVFEKNLQFSPNRLCVRCLKPTWCWRLLRVYGDGSWRAWALRCTDYTESTVFCLQSHLVRG